MKIKWTTITKDESTWPTVNSFLLNDGTDTTQWIRIEDGRFKDLKTDTYWLPGGMEYWKWRLMPKPTKKRNKIRIPVEQYKELLNSAGLNPSLETSKKLIEHVIKTFMPLEDIKSPWINIKNRPIPHQGMKILCRKSVNGEFRYSNPSVFEGWKSNMKEVPIMCEEYFYKNYDEWMEIPE